MAPDSHGKKKKKNEEPSRRFAYSEEALTSALSDIRGNIRGIREACRQYGVPRSTIQDRLSGRVADQRRKVGPDPIFGFDGEKKIVDWIIELAKAGIPINKYDLLDTVAELAIELGIDHRFPGGKPGIRWYLSFLKRHPNISIREPEAINKAREAIKESTIRKWFADLHTFLVERNAIDILDDPSRILNADETGVSLSPKSGKVLAPKGYKNVYVVKKGNEKENITVLVVITASGEICPPLVVFPYKRPPKAVVDSMPPDWILGKSETGWMRSDTFFEYMSNGFNDWLTKQNVKKPVLFFVDGHKSHMSMPLSKFCEDNDIILYALPPNATHILQPADVSVFKPLKQEWKRTVKKWQSRSENLNKCVTKTNFCQVFKETLDMDMTQTIKNGFRKCGLYPFDVEQVDFSKCVKDAQIRNTIAAQTNSQRPLNERHFEIARKVFYLMEENICKLGINPSIILRELDRTKESYLQKRRSKSKTPRTSQSSSIARRSKSLEVNKSSKTPETSRSSSIPRHSKSFEVNQSSDKTTKTPRPPQSGSILENSKTFEVKESSDMISKTPRGLIYPSTSTPRHSESFDFKNPSDKPSKSARPKTSGFFSVQDMDHSSIQIPEIGSYVSLNDISIAPFSNVHLSKICQASNDIVIPFDDSPTIDVIQIETVAELHEYPSHPDMHTNLEAKESEEMYQDQRGNIRMDISLGDIDYDHVLLNRSLDVSPDKQQTCTKKSDRKKIPPIIISYGNTEARTISDMNLASSALKIDDVNIIGQADNDFITLPETESILPTESLNNKSGYASKIKIIENILIASAPETPANLIDEDPFKKHLKFPDVVTKNNGTTLKSNQFPSAITSKAWQQYYEKKEKAKQDKENQIKKRKLERELKRKEPPSKKNRMKKKKVEETQSRIKCSSCYLDLISDTEEEGEMNIGCDQCIRWYHLKCTKLKNLSYNQAATKPYECMLCETVENARREVLKAFNNNTD